MRREPSTGQRSGSPRNWRPLRACSATGGESSVLIVFTYRLTRVGTGVSWNSWNVSGHTSRPRSSWTLERAFLSVSVLAGALAGAAGLLYAFNFRTSAFRQGPDIGLIALTAAVLGGIGSLVGALLGARTIGLGSVILVRRSAFILGGGGQVGRAAARRLAETGWDVTTGQRGEIDASERHDPAIRRVRVDRDRAGDLEAALGDGVDVLIDVISYTAKDAEQLLSVCERLSSLVAISSASVYRDDEGRTLDEASDEATFPEFPFPIAEDHPTVPAGDATYSTEKAAMERTLLERASVPATIIRPCAIHGPGSRQAREWYFLKRALDRRPAFLHAYRGETIFHTTSVANLAELIRLACERPGTRVLNCGDPDPPPVVRIGRAVAATIGYEPVDVLIPGPPPAANIGESPWTGPRSMVLDMARPEQELGYRPVTTYDDAVGETCTWLLAATRERDWKAALPDLARYPIDLFDYDAEDAYLSSLTARSV